MTRNYSYDAAGNLLADGTHTFTYNDAGRMVTAGSGGNQTLYTYNAMGQRVKKSNASGATYFVYDESDHLLGEYGTNGELIQEIVWFENIPIAAIRLGGTGPQIDVLYIHADHLNAPARISAPSTNAIVWRWDHDPYGNGAPNEDPDGNGHSLQFNLRFPGQYFDAETGLHYNYFRDYDPAVGRYVQSDPIGLDGGANTYGYADMNPASNIDPSGLGFIDPNTVLDIGDFLRDVNDASKSGTLPLPGRPKKVPGMVACHARCPTIPTVCPEPNCPVVWGYGVGATVLEAKNAARADANAQSPAGCQLKHCTYKCTGTKGQPIYPSR